MAVKLADKFFKAPQSKVAAYAYVILACYILLLAIVRQQSALLYAAVPVAFSTLFTMYAINCMVYGTCTVYAWLTVILTIVTLMSTMVSITGASFLAQGTSSNEQGDR